MECFPQSQGLNQAAWLPGDRQQEGRMLVDSSAEQDILGDDEYAVTLLMHQWQRQPLPRVGEWNRKRHSLLEGKDQPQRA